MENMMEAIQRDPELMSMMMQPGVMQQLMQLQQDPSRAAEMMQSDPNLSRIYQRMMAISGGGGGMGGGMGGGAAGGGGAAHSRHVTVVDNMSQFQSALRSVRVAIVYFTATWCGPCRRIGPEYDTIASEYGAAGKMGFFKADVDRARDVAQANGVEAMPTFIAFVEGQSVETLKGPDPNALRNFISRHSAAAEPPPPVEKCPYTHFPLREAETVSYKNIKYEPVLKKARELNAGFQQEVAPDVLAGAPQALSAQEMASLESIPTLLEAKQTYHSSEVNAAQFAALHKMLSWPGAAANPALHICRMLVLHPFAANYYTLSTSLDLITHLCSIATTAAKSNLPLTAYLAIRTLANMFSRRVLQKYLLLRHEPVIETLTNVFLKSADAECRLSCVGLFINFAIGLSETNASVEARVHAISNVLAMMQVADSEPLNYRLLCILGSLLYKSPDSIAVARELGFVSLVLAAKRTYPESANAVGAADELLQLMRTQS